MLLVELWESIGVEAKEFQADWTIFQLGEEVAWDAVVRQWVADENLAAF